MNVNDVIADGQRYFKLNEGESCVVIFGDNFVKNESVFEGRKTIKYEVQCVVKTNDGQFDKIWGGSSKFFEECVAKAQEYGFPFSDTVFEVSRTGQMKDTRYHIKVLRNRNNA